MKTRISFLALSALAVSSALGGLAAYDDKIAADNAAGLSYTALSTTTLTFDGNNQEPFDFGTVSGSSTIEFILSGDPVAGGRDGYLAVGANSTWNLRYEQWDDTGQLGFTHLGVADYLFTPADVPPPTATFDSPTDLTHVTYRWDQATTTMELYLDGVLVGINDTATGFQMPAGLGTLGNNAGLSEGMLGTIERFTAYNDAVDPATILAHAEAWNGPGGSLANYDTVIANDNAGALPYTAVSTTTLNFDTTNSEPIDFGAIAGSATFEFIVSGDPVAGGPNGFLAVGADPLFSLRFEQWNDTGQLGFTHGGVADYLFVDTNAPSIPTLDSPTELTHVVYRWDQDTTTMELYLDGVLAGTNNAAAGYEMPSGAGFLGNNAGNTEGMLGVIERVTVYNEAISPDDIVAHANAWLGLVAPTLGLAVEAEGDDLKFTWTSRAGKVYDLLSDTTLTTAPATWAVFDGHEGIAATPAENTLTIPRPEDSERFFVIQERPAPPFFADDFESGQGTWTVGSDGSAGTAWEFGAPSVVGPATANSGTNCFGTNLAADYEILADVWLRSPVIDLSDPGIASASVRFAHYQALEPMFDEGTVRAVDAVTNAPLGADIAVFDGNGATWGTSSGDLPPEAIGQMIKIEFRFQSDNFNNNAGWYIDDVELSVLGN